MSLPIREGRLEIRKVSENSDESFRTSSHFTRPLINEIMKQSDDVPSPEEVQEAKRDSLSRTTAQETARTNSIKSTQTAQMQRTLEQLSEPGASSWLGALPLKSQGFNLTKSEFHDVMALRYHKEVKNLPSTCPCGQPKSRWRSNL